MINGLMPMISPTMPMSMISGGSPLSEHRDVHLARQDQTAVFAAQTDRHAAVPVDQGDDLLVDLADQHHLDDVHRLLVGDAHAAHEAAVMPILSSILSICGPPPCTTTGLMPTYLSSTMSCAKLVLELLVDPSRGRRT